MSYRYKARGRGGYRRSGYRHNAGLEAAKRHIQEARQFTAELGGVDQDVKHYFFSLPPNELHAVLQEYGEVYGERAKEYAAQTIDKWRLGRTQMSGMVAERLFNLLPPRMPLEAKYNLVKSLWHHVCPKTYRSFLVGPDVNDDALEAQVREYLLVTVVDHRLPDAMERRFAWLSAGDISVRQMLLNHLNQMERNMVLGALAEELPLFLHQIRERADVTSRLTRIITIGKHECVLTFDPKVSGITPSNHPPSSWSPVRSSKSGRGAIWIILLLVVLSYLLFGR